jgi:competence protein ComEC
MRGGVIYAVSIGICAGITCALIFGFGTTLAVFFIVAAVLCVVLRQQNPKILLLAAGLCAAALGLLRTDIFLQAQHQEVLPHYIGQTATVTGVVASDPDKRETSLRVAVTVHRIDTKKADGTLLVVLPRETKIFFHDQLEVEGKIIAPQTFETNTGHIFDYPSYLRVQGISALMQYATLDTVVSGSFSLQGTLFSIKHRFERSLERLLPEPDASLMEGILLGERRGIPSDLTQDFVTSGLVHVVVLSGYNISVVSEATMRLFSFLPRTLGFSFGGITMLLFALMTGAGATTVRASIMGLIAILARYAHRPTAALRALASAAAGMALWNPLVLLFDPSFILSVLATFGLIAFSPAIEKKLTWIPEKFGLRSIAASTISVQLFVLPALLYFTGMLSFMALPANILALPVVSFAMLGGFIAGSLGLLHPALGFIPGIFTDLLLRWMMLVAHTAATLPFAYVTIPQFSAWIVATAYAPLTWFALRLYNANQSHSN